MIVWLVSLETNPKTKNLNWDVEKILNFDQHNAKKTNKQTDIHWWMLQANLKGST